VIYAHELAETSGPVPNRSIFLFFFLNTAKILLAALLLPPTFLMLTSVLVIGNPCEGRITSFFSFHAVPIFLFSNLALSIFTSPSRNVSRTRGMVPNANPWFSKPCLPGLPFGPFQWSTYALVLPFSIQNLDLGLGYIATDTSPHATPGLEIFARPSFMHFLLFTCGDLIPTPLYSLFSSVRRPLCRIGPRDPLLSTSAVRPFNSLSLMIALMTFLIFPPAPPVQVPLLFVITLEWSLEGLRLGSRFPGALCLIPLLPVGGLRCPLSLLLVYKEGLLPPDRVVPPKIGLGAPLGLLLHLA